MGWRDRSPCQRIKILECLIRIFVAGGESVKREQQELKQPPARNASEMTKRSAKQDRTLLSELLWM